MKKSIPASHHPDSHKPQQVWQQLQATLSCHCGKKKQTNKQTDHMVIYGFDPTAKLALLDNFHIISPVPSWTNSRS